MQAHDALPWTASSALSLTSTERAQTSAEISTSDGVTNCTPSRLRNDLAIAACSSCATTINGRCLPQASTSAAASFVEGSPNESSARRPNVPSSACADRAARKAALRSLRLTLWPKLVRTWNAAPPPVQCGARVVPARARPVPFWRHGFERPPATSPRVLTARVPARSASSTGALGRRLGDAAWRSDGLCPADRLVPASDLGAATAPLLPYLHEAV